jgi:hypothetical protein
MWTAGYFMRFAWYVLLGLLTIETAARIEDCARYGASPIAPYSINTIFRSGPYGREGRPGARYAKWSLNSLGFRGPEILPERINVVVFGASETFGTYESPGEEYPRQLEAALNSEGRTHYNVINIALPGMRIGNVEYLDRAMRMTGAKYVVVYPSPANYIGTTSAFCGKPHALVAEQLTWSDYIRLAERLSQLAKAYVPSKLMTALRTLDIRLHARDREVMGRVPESSLDAFRSDLNCVIQVTQSSGALPILLTHATYFGGQVNPEDRPMMLAWRRFYPELAESGFLDLEDRANEAIRMVARNTGARLVDAAKLMPPGPTYFADFVHFTDGGSARMAALIGTQITSEH